MRVSGVTAAIAAGASSGNVLQGKISEIMQSRGVIKIYATASQVGGQATFTSGSQVVLEPGSAVSQANRAPVIPDDLLATDVALAGDRLNLNFTNTAATATTFYWAVDIVFG